MRPRSCYSLKRFRAGGGVSKRTHPDTALDPSPRHSAREATGKRAKQGRESGLLLLPVLHRPRAVRNSPRQSYCPRFSSDGGSDASTHLYRSGSQVTAKSGLTLLFGEQRLTSGI